MRATQLVMGLTAAWGAFAPATAFADSFCSGVRSILHHVHGSENILNHDAAGREVSPVYAEAVRLIEANRWQEAATLLARVMHDKRPAVVASGLRDDASYLAGLIRACPAWLLTDDLMPVDGPARRLPSATPRVFFP